MSVDAINSAVVSASQSTKRAATSHSSQSSAAPHDGIKDTITLSPEAIKVDTNRQFGEPIDYSQDQRLNAKKWENWHTSMELSYQYHKAEQSFRQENFDKMNAIHEQLRQESGGILYGAAYSPDAPSKPITTTSGKPHPLADQIRAFVIEHKAQYDQMEQLREAEFMSFDQWLADQAKTA